MPKRALDGHHVSTTERELMQESEESDPIRVVNMREKYDIKTASWNG